MLNRRMFGKGLLGGVLGALGLLRAKPESAEDKLARITPDNKTLLKWACRPENQPPQWWWDDTNNPFEGRSITYRIEIRGLGSCDLKNKMEGLYELT